VPVFGFGDDNFGDEGAMIWETKKPIRTTNGNARMRSTISRFRVFKVMPAAGFAKNPAASIIQMLTRLPELL